MPTYYFNFQPVWASFDKLLMGLALGLGMAVLSLAIGSLIGVALAFARQSSVGALRWLAWLYVELFRNSPLLLLIFFVFYGLPELGFYGIDKYGSFILALSLYAGAYLAEIVRSGLVSVGRNYTDAAKAIGLAPWQQKLYVVMPLTLRVILPSLGNNFISLFKDTALATAIAVPELTFEARAINTYTFRVIETWLVAGGLYLATCYAIAGLLRLAERRYAVIR